MNHVPANILKQMESKMCLSAAFPTSTPRGKERRGSDSLCRCQGHWQGSGESNRKGRKLASMYHRVITGGNWSSVLLSISRSQPRARLSTRAHAKGASGHCQKAPPGVLTLGLPPAVLTAKGTPALQMLTAQVLLDWEGPGEFGQRTTWAATPCLEMALNRQLGVLDHAASP